MPIPKGNPVWQSGWFDANLQHDMVTSRSAMGTFHMVQNTVVASSSKHQSTVETATYATEFIAGRTCLDEAIALRYELWMLGVPLDGPVWMFDDNQLMINSSSEPSGTCSVFFAHTVGIGAIGAIQRNSAQYGAIRIHHDGK
jgi:hypothetical protein